MSRPRALPVSAAVHVCAQLVGFVVLLVIGAPEVPPPTVWDLAVAEILDQTARA